MNLEFQNFRIFCLCATYAAATPITMAVETRPQNLFCEMAGKAGIRLQTNLKKFSPNLVYGGYLTGTSSKE